MFPVKVNLKHFFVPKAIIYRNRCRRTIKLYRTLTFNNNQKNPPTLVTFTLSDSGWQAVCLADSVNYNAMMLYKSEKAIDIII